MRGSEKIHQTIADTAIIIQLTANQTLWFQQEWSDFSKKISHHLQEGTLTTEHCLEIYNWLSYFHNSSESLQTACNTILELQNLKILSLSHNENYKLLQKDANEIRIFFDRKGKNLWALIKKIINTNIFFENYEGIPTAYFLDRTNSLKVFLDSLPRDQKFVILAPQSQHKPPKISPTSSSPIAYKLSSSPSFSSPLGSQTPPVRRNSKTAIDPDFAKQLLTEGLISAFEQDPLWKEQVENFKNRALLLINAKFILTPLLELVRYYANFKNYQNNLEKAYDILTPKACLVMSDLPPARIPQSVAREVGVLDSNGPLCFGEVVRDPNECELSRLDVCINNIIFRQMTIAPLKTDNLFKWHFLESLFGIPSIPMEFIDIDKIVYFKKSSNEKAKSASLITKTVIKEITNQFVTSPETRVKLTKSIRSLTQQKFEGKFLSNFFEAIESGRGSFEQLDTKSVGEQTLFCLLIQASLPASNLGLVEKNGKYSLQRLSIALKEEGEVSCLKPSFNVINVKQFDNLGYQIGERTEHGLLEKNIFYLLPSARKEIPKQVKESFLSNNILLVLSYWLKQLHNIEEGYFNKIIEAHQLNEIPDLYSTLNLMQAQTLGCVISFHPSTIEQLIRNFSIIKNELAKPHITYLEVLKAVRPQVFGCYNALIEKVSQEIEAIKPYLFFKNVAASLIEQLHHLFAQQKDLGSEPAHTLEELEMYKEQVKSCLAEFEENKGDAFIKIIRLLDPGSREFWCKKFKWAEERGTFQIETINKVWALLYDCDKPVTPETLKLTELKWADVPLLDGTVDPIASEFLGSTATVKYMVQSLITEADLSLVSSDRAIEIIATLIDLLPRSPTCHSSWIEVLSRKQFLALPLNVQDFYRHNHSEIDQIQKLALQAAQLQTFERSQKLIESLKGKLVSVKQPAEHFFRQLCTGSLERDSTQKDDTLFFDAILDLLLLPSYSPLALSSVESETPSIGLASHPSSREGIFDLRYRVGDHYILSCSEKWFYFYNSPQILSSHMRSALLSNALPLMLLQWLHTLNQLKPDIEFHPWFMEKLIEKYIHFSKIFY